ncbi:MAG: hypothetical protein NVS9B10_20080 [Nevskia sp.]
MTRPEPAAADARGSDAGCGCGGGPAALRPVYIDALNTAYWCSNPPSLRLPLTLLAALLAEGREATLYFDASARYRLRPDETARYAQLLRHARRAIEVPSGRPADRVLLQQARAADAAILSRDRFRDHRRRFRRLIDDPARLFAGTVHDDRVHIPALALAIPLPATVDAAWARLEALLVLDAGQAAPPENPEPR